jgi:hypothetical protein
MTFHGRLAKMGSSKNSLDTISESISQADPLLKLSRLRSWSISGGFDTGQSAKEQLFNYRSIVSIYAGRASHAAEAEAVKLFGLSLHESYSIEDFDFIP